MNVYILNERPLNDDTLYISDDNKVFKGGYKAIVEYYTYANEWSDHKHYRRFKNLNTLHAYLNKNYPNFEI